jgi:hypothetical protein
MKIIKYEIEITSVEEYSEEENLLVKRVPTALKEKGRYDSDEKHLCEEHYAVKTVLKNRERQVLKQQVDADKFSLQDVIKAINGIKP